MKRDRSYITRRIYFYRINVGSNVAGQPLIYNIKKALEAIGKLSFLNDDRYLKDEDGFDICCWIDEFSPSQKVRFGKIRREDFPQIEHRGNLTDLSMPEESGLAECVHAMFFPENIVGIEYNYDGPRVTRISEYLHVKSHNICPQIPTFEHLLQNDVIEKLNHMQTVRQFKLRVRESLFSSTEQADENLAQAFHAARELGQAKEIELILSAGREKGTLGTKVRDVAKRLLALRDTNNDVIKGEIKGYDESGELEVIDLLNAKLVVEKNIPRSKTRTNVPQSPLVYAAIEEAYNDMKDKIKSALGVALCPK